MSLHPQAKALLEMFESRGVPPTEQQSVQEARTAYAKMCQYFNKPVEVHTVEDRRIRGYQNDISIRIYTPSEGKALPAIVYFHGGGWVIGDLETHDALCRTFANEADCIVISVDYSLSPEHKFPVAVEDAYMAVQWTAEHAEELGIEKNNLAVGGDSAGGNLAAVVCNLAIERQGAAIDYQMLFYPSTGFQKTSTLEKYGENYHLTKATMKWFQENYFNSFEDTKNPLAAPMLIPDSVTSMLPPAYIMTAEYDPLCDGGEMYANKLKKAGVATTYVCYPGMIHGFLTMSEPLDDCRIAIKQAAQSLQSHFSKTTISGGDNVTKRDTER